MRGKGKIIAGITTYTADSQQNSTKPRHRNNLNVNCYKKNPRRLTETRNKHPLNKHRIMFIMIMWSNKHFILTGRVSACSVGGQGCTPYLVKLETKYLVVLSPFLTPKMTITSLLV